MHLDDPLTSVHVLPPVDWARLRNVEPFAKAGTLPDPRFATVLVEENGAGEIVGCWMVTSVMLLEGLWRREDHRKKFSAKRLLVGMVSWLKQHRTKSAMTIIEDPAVAALATRAGFEKVSSGAIYGLTLGE